MDYVSPFHYNPTSFPRGRRMLQRMVILVAMMLAVGCHGEPVTPRQGGVPHQWISLAIPEAEAAVPPSREPVAETTDSVIEEEEEKETVAHCTDATRFVPREIQTWTLFDHLGEASVASPRRMDLQEEALLETTYRAPFAQVEGTLSLLARRVIAVDLKKQNYDMRDAVILPVPSQLETPLPQYDNARLSFAYSIVPGAFPGGEGGKVSLRLALLDKTRGASRALGQVTVDAQAPGDRREWHEVTVPLPKKGDSPEVLAINVLSEEDSGTPSAGVAVANLSVFVERKTPAASVEEEIPPEGPNVVVVFIDAARSDCVGPGNGTFPSVTPRLDALAKGGVTFTNAFSVSNQTRPSIVGFLQSQHPTAGEFHSRWWRLKIPQIKRYYETDPPLIPRLLRKAGYVTASIGRNHFQYGTTRMGLDPGFETVWDNRRSQKDTVFIIERAKEWIATHHKEKFFLLVNISPPHQPYNAPEKYLKWTRERLKDFKGDLPAMVEFLAEIYYADQMLGELFDTINELKLDDNTVILVTADHGETMHPAHTCHSELFKTICHNSHGLTLYDEELHIPLIIKAPFLDAGEPGVRTNVVTHLDVAPTLLALLGLPEHPRHTGRSRVPDLLGEAKEDTPVYVEARLSSAIRHEGWKFIYHHKKDDARTPAWKSGPQGTLMELYSLKDDPSETRNLVDKNLIMAEVMRKLLREVRTGYKEKVTQGFGKAWKAIRRLDLVVTPLPLEERGKEPVDSKVFKGTPAESGGKSLEKPEAPAVPVPEATPPEGMNGKEPQEESEAGATPTRQSGYVHLTLNREGERTHFSGDISVEGGALVLVEAEQHTACLQVVDEGHMKVDCEVEEEPLSWRFQTDPPRSPMTFEMTMDSKPLNSNRIYLGRYGLGLLHENRIETGEQWRLAYSPRPPHFLPGFDGGMFLWSSQKGATSGEGLGSPEGGEFEGERIEDGSTRKVLKNLGYWN